MRENKKFKFMKKLGAGSFGSVYSVKKLSGIEANQIYAMKVCSKRNRSTTENELKILKMTSGCEFVVALKYAFQSSSKLFLCLELINIDLHKAMNYLRMLGIESDSILCIRNSSFFVEQLE